MGSPRLRAVFALIASTNLDGRAIGRSGALAPSSILATYRAASRYRAGTLGAYDIRQPFSTAWSKRANVGRLVLIAHSHMDCLFTYWSGEPQKNTALGRS